MYRPSAYPGRYVSILNELFVHPNGDIERGRVLNTADLFKDIDFVVTSLAIGDDGRVFVLAESLTSAESSESGYINRTTLFEWTAGSSFLPRFTWWKEEHGGNLLAVDLDGVTLNPDGTSTPVHPPKELVVRFGNTVKVFRTDSDVLNEIWSGYLPPPLEPGAFLLGHTEEKDFLTSDPDGPLSMTFQGELIPGNLNADGNLDLLSYCDGLRVLPGNGDGKFSDYYAIDPNFSPTNACLGDVDGNGTNEILAVRGNELRIYVHTPDASFPTIPIPPPGGQVTTLAGEFLNMETGQSGVRGVEFQQARRLAVGADRIFVSDTEGNCVLSRPEGQGWQILNDANSNLLDLSSPMGLLFTDNRLLICDSGHHRILSYYPNTGETTLIAGTGEEGNTGDGGPAIHAAFSYPCDLAAMPAGRLVIADTGIYRLRILDPYTGIIDNLLPADSQLQLIEPVAVESDGTGSLFVAESSPCRVRRFFQQDGTWQTETIAGGSCGEETPNLPVGSALMFPEDLALMPDGSLLIADTGNQRILRYSGGSNEWLAGSGVLGYVYENLPLRVFHFDAPSGFGIVSESELLVADGRSIRRLQIGEAGPGSPDLPRPGDLPQATPIPIPSPTLSPTPIPVDQYLIGPVYYEENGHYYAFARQKLSWTASSEFAASRFDGSGYLATITSSSENGFLIAFLKTMASLYLLDGAWLGGYQDPDLDESTSASYAQGWHWVTDEPWVYANWAEDEPDDSLNADNLCFCTSRTEYWDDRPGTQIRYSVIEWDHDPRMQPTGTATRTPIARPTETPTATPSVTPTRTPTPSLTPTPQGKPTHRPGITVEIPGLPSDAIPLEMVLIPAGTFLMGSQPDERGRSSDEAQHQVTISQDFYIGKYEITQAQWRAVMKSNPSTNVTGGSHPVESVSWNDCQTFIQTLNQMRPESAEKFRLPTEAEWEYACRERTTTRFYWGDDLNETEIGKHAWYTGNSPSITQRVGRKIPNAWGLYDMNGNVWEWCHDLYGSYPSGLAVDLMCEQPGDTKYVIRGGSCSCPARLCRSACRLKTGFVGPDVGFRVVLSSLTP